MGDRLNPEQRQHDLGALGSDDFDVVVVGGGITGAGVALDAASRGLKTALIEAQDWASGTSSRSSRLVLGGLRYLNNFGIGLVSELVRERGLLVRTIAPHMVRPQPFIWPLRSRLVERSRAISSIGVYDLLTKTVGRMSLPLHRHRNKSGTLARVPGLRSDGLVGGLEFYDARVDDARLVLQLVRTALEYGARAVSRAEVIRLSRAEDGPSNGLHVRDLETGTEFYVRTRGVVLATGAWTEETQGLAETSSGLQVLTSKGSHILVAKDKIDSQTGIYFPYRDSAISIIPLPRQWLIGTTDTPWQGPLTHPVPTSEDIDFLLAGANQVLARPLTRDDVEGSFAGLRPLLQRGQSDDVRTTRMSREHAVAQVAPGVVAVAGGKLTSYRLMAAHAVDFLLGKQLAGERPSVTHRTPLLGAQGIEAMANQSDRIGGIYGWNREQMTHLLERYGAEVTDLLEMVDDDPTLAASLQGAPDYLRVEVARACVAEGALHLEDIMVHRLRLNTEYRDRGVAAVDEVAGIAAPLLDWDAERCADEKQNYLDRVAAEIEAAAQPSDTAAVQARLQAADIVANTLG